jgi:hypothetical protein
MVWSSVWAEGGLLAGKLEVHCGSVRPQGIRQLLGQTKPGSYVLGGRWHGETRDGALEWRVANETLVGLGVFPFSQKEKKCASEKRISLQL